jgi:hypothetical protein
VNQRLFFAGVSILLASCGGDGGSGGSAPPPDTSAPQTTIAASPAALTNSAAASFSFAASETATFEVSLDGGAFFAVTSPYVITGLTSGSHTLQVRAKDAANNIDDSPATYTWTVDLVAPATSISAGPPALTASTDASFTFGANETATFEVRLDGAAFAPATSPHVLTGLTAGPHTFEVRSRDIVGNLESAAAAFSWTVNLTPPQASIVFPMPVSYTDASTVTVRGVASSDQPLQGVTVNGVAATSATAFNTWSAVIPVAYGDNPVTVSVTDTIGNTNPNAATASIANRGPAIVWARGADYDPASDSVIVVNSDLSEVLGIRVSDGSARHISRRSQAADPNNTALSGLVVDAATNRAFSIDRAVDSIVAIDLATGARTTISPRSTSTPTIVTHGNFISSIERGGYSLLVSVGQAVGPAQAILFAGEEDGGWRNLFTGLTRGSGPAFSHPTAAYLDGPDHRLMFGATVNGESVILAADIVTWGRSVISRSPDIGQGPAFTSFGDAHFDPSDRQLYVSDPLANALFRVDVVTGDRTIIAGAGVGSGPALDLRGEFAFKPSTRQIFAAQREGKMLAVDTTTLERTSMIDARVGSGVDLGHPASLSPEQVSGPLNSLLFSEPDGARLMRLTLATGETSVVSGGTVGTGPELTRLVDLVVDSRAPANGNAALGLLASPGNALVSIDLATGNRSVHTPLTPNSGLRNVGLDAAGNRAFFTYDGGTNESTGLYTVDLATSQISQIHEGNDRAYIPGASHFVLAPLPNPTRAFVVDKNASRLVRIDLSTGERLYHPTPSPTPPPNTLLGPIFFDAPDNRVFAYHNLPRKLETLSLGEYDQVFGTAVVSGWQANGAVRGLGPTIDFASGLIVDRERDLAFASDSSTGSIFAIDLISGDRVIIAR